MADATVAAALRSDAGLVVVEAPGGCGKTYQGAAFAAEVCSTLAPGRLLILTHTHAACDVFADRTRGLAGLEIRTIDSLIAQIAEAYPEPGTQEVLGPPDYDRNGRWAASLLKRWPFIAAVLARRYPMVICDEHQDASADQHRVIDALHLAGAKIRAFGDPMQRIYGASSTTAEGQADDERWAAFQNAADVSEVLDVPHRWEGGSEGLGKWILESRATLAAGGKLRLTGTLPRQLNVVFADNTAQKNLGFQLEARERQELDPQFGGDQPLLVLSHHNATVQAIRAFLGRSIPIWEGHTRSALPVLVQRLAKSSDAAAVADAAVSFVQEVCTGFSDSQLAMRFRHEVAAGCTKPLRGKPAQIQALARLIVDQPDHRGVGAFLQALHAAKKAQPKFTGIHIDYPREYWEAVRIGTAVDPQAGLAGLTRQNAHVRRHPPKRAISTIHKAKGLEAPHVLVMPCDATTFREKDRRLLYVAISRATHRLTLVVSRSKPSPIIDI